MSPSELPFIDSVIQRFVEKDPEAASNTCFIFPTRRACLIFRNKLADASKGPIWAPGVLSIRDFVEVHSRIKIADEKELLLLLYGINRNYFPGQSFTRFHSWGQMLLNDFDEVDKQLEHPEELFTGIKEIKQLEQHFAADEEALEWIRNFTGIFDPEKLTELQKKFAFNWEQLIHIYREFRDLLTSRKTGYEGLAYRQLLDALKSGSFDSRWNTFVFAGFYGLSAVEEQLIAELGKKFNVVMEWDADKYYISDINNHEAGRYFRNLKKHGTLQEKDHFTGRPVSISVTGVPMRSGQAKYAGHLLNEMLKNGSLDPDKTAVILPDESQLFPVLYSLPAEIHPVNVTMGLPLRHTVYADLATACRDLFCGCRKSSTGQISYYHEHLESVSNNPLVKRIAKAAETENPEGFKAWLKPGEVGERYGEKLASSVSSPPSTAAGAAKYLSEIFTEINHYFSGTGNTFDSEVSQFVASELAELSEMLKDYEDGITAEDGWHIVAEVVSLLKLPFSGEPVKGLQVMGFLETRALDFETVIILGCNEDILPRNSQSKSFIPFSLRRAFGLGTYLEQDASSAYHFYRLFHKAKNIFLVYDTEIRGLTGSEASRYILQLQHEFRHHPGFNVTWNRQVVHTPVRINQTKPASVRKTNEILNALSKYTQAENGGRFSSSSLTTYISCGLRFYYNYVAGIREQRDEAGSIEADVFGKILHTALENLYGPFKEKEVTSSDIDGLLKKSDSAVEEATRKEFGSGTSQLEGNDRILSGALKELVRRILNADKKTTPFELLALEGTYEMYADTGSGKVKLLGIFDRVDRYKGSVRIIDYKTGKVKTSLQKDLEKIFLNPDYKTLFQLFFYAHVYRHNHPNEHILPGFFVAQSLSEGITFADMVNAENADWFNDRLNALLREIMDPTKEFEPTSDAKRCEYCPYRDICHR